MAKKPLVVPFTKMNGAGNDFIVLDNRFYHFNSAELADLARRFCPRRTGIGADGLLALCPPDADASAEEVHYRMRYRNADGSRAGMCGNGARCLARFARTAGLGPGGTDSTGEGAEQEESVTLAFASDAGVHRATVPAASDAPVRFHAAPPGDFEPDVPLRTEGLAAQLPGPVAFIHTGTQHAVLFVARAEDAPVVEWGPLIRRDAAFAPTGANANFVEIVGEGDGASPARLRVRTFEKGVEDETLACGTGALAAAVAAYRTGRIRTATVEVEMPGGLLSVGFRVEGGAPAAAIEDLYLEGPAETVFQGTVEVWM